MSAAAQISKNDPRKELIGWQNQTGSEFCVMSQQHEEVQAKTNPLKTIVYLNGAI